MESSLALSSSSSAQLLIESAQAAEHNARGRLMRLSHLRVIAITFVSVAKLPQVWRDGAQKLIS